MTFVLRICLCYAIENARFCLFSFDQKYVDYYHIHCLFKLAGVVICFRSFFALSKINSISVPLIFSSDILATFFRMNEFTRSKPINMPEKMNKTSEIISIGFFYSIFDVRSMDIEQEFGRKQTVEMNGESQQFRIHIPICRFCQIILVVLGTRKNCGIANRRTLTSIFPNA